MTGRPAAAGAADVRAEVEGLVAAGRSRRDAVDEVAARHGLRRSEVYRIATTAEPVADRPAE